jgi:2-dehydropantoate 2-reductase
VRVVVCGAGAVGGGVGGLLHAAGTPVVLVARGAHGEACAKGGLVLMQAERTRTLRIPTVTRVGDIAWLPGDVVLLATKLQDAPALLDELAQVAPAGTLVVCAQNGLAGERMASRRGFRSAGMLVWLPATHLVPGEVRLHGAPNAGILDLGLWPAGADDTLRELADRLSAADFDAVVRDDIMAWKRTKLVSNTVGVLHAVLNGPFDDLAVAVREECLAVFRAAEMDLVSDEVFAQRVSGLEQVAVGTREREGGSAWQSLVRGRSSEVHYLCGEVMLLGAQFGVPTPVNRAVQALTVQLVAQGARPRSLDPRRVRDWVAGGR